VLQVLKDLLVLLVLLEHKDQLEIQDRLVLLVQQVRLEPQERLVQLDQLVLMLQRFQLF
jgi:hypothetical protein